MQIKYKLIKILAVAVFLLPNFVTAAEHVIKAGPRAFEPPIIYIAEGDKVMFSKMVSHNSVSIDGMIPEGATAWAGKLGENINLTLEKPGIYAYVCVPHIGFGMLGIIVVGDINADEVAAYKQHAIDTLEGPYRRLLGLVNKLKATK